MKTIIPIIACISLFGFTACNNNAISGREAILLSQQRTIDSMNAELVKKRVIDSMNEITKVQYVLPQNNMPVAAPHVQQSAPRTVYVRESRSRNYSSRPRTRRVHQESIADNEPVASQTPVAQAPVQQPQTSTQPVIVQEPQPQRERRGWSAKAKGAVIGAGTGAAAGAILNGRNRVAGAVIGGILGAGAGTGIGAVIDRKNNR